MSEVELKRRIGWFHGIGYTWGVMVGGGIFVAPVAVLSGTGSVSLSLILWLLGGIYYSIFTIAYIELGTTLPGNGENYHYLDKIFGSFSSFSFMWMHSLILRPSSDAIKCVIFSNYMLELAFPVCTSPWHAKTLIALAVICKYLCNMVGKPKNPLLLKL